MSFLLRDARSKVRCVIWTLELENLMHRKLMKGVEYEKLNIYELFYVDLIKIWT